VACGRGVGSPNDGTGTTDNALTAIGGTQATGLWAVGWRQSPAGFKPLVLRYDTTRPSPSWVSVSGAGGVPSPGTVETVLTGVDVRTASDVWAVGYYDNGSVKRPLALHWNGSNWCNSPVPGAGLLRDVRAVTSGNVWTAGTYYNAGEHRTKTLVVHFDGTTWATVKSADAASGNDELIGLATGKAGSMITVVGRRGSSQLIEQANSPAGPVSLPSQTAASAPPAPAAPGAGPTPPPAAQTPAPISPVSVTVTDKAAAAGLPASRICPGVRPPPISKQTAGRICSSPSISIQPTCGSTVTTAPLPRATRAISRVSTGTTAWPLISTRMAGKICFAASELIAAPL
jgi:hypothetical protein